MAEIRDIVGFGGKYQITSTGKVLNKKTGKEIKPYVVRGGYLQVGLWSDGKRHNQSLHRLVAKSFIPNPDDKPCIDHINTDRQDNRVENLRWVSYSENMKNSKTLGKISKVTKGSVWWNNGRKEQRSFKKLSSPWKRGRLPQTNNKISKSLEGKKLSKATRAKMSATHKKKFAEKGKFHWWTDGERIVASKEKPEEGFYVGRLKKCKSAKNKNNF